MNDRPLIYAISSAPLIGAMGLLMILSGCVTNHVIHRPEGGFTRADPLVVMAEDQDALGMKGRVEHLLLSLGFNVISDVGERRRYVVTQQEDDGQPNGAGLVNRVTTEMRDDFPVDFAFRFGYQVDPLGEVIKFTGSIVDLRTGAFTFSYEFEDGLITPFEPAFLGRELAAAFPRNAIQTIAGVEDSGNDTAERRRNNPQTGNASGSPSGAASSAQAFSAQVELIREIAWQTNTLAINAAADAARREDPDHPMAVIAERLKGISERSAQALRAMNGLANRPGARQEMAELWLERLVPELTSINSDLNWIATTTASTTRNPAASRSLLSQATNPAPGAAATPAESAKAATPAAARQAAQAGIAPTSLPIRSGGPVAQAPVEDAAAPAALRDPADVESQPVDWSRAPRPNHAPLPRGSVPARLAMAPTLHPMPPPLSRPAL